MFLCVKGVFTVRFRDHDVNLNEGDCVFVPRNVEHQTAAQEEAHILYISKKGSVNTGNVKDEHTVENPEKI